MPDTSTPPRTADAAVTDAAALSVSAASKAQTIKDEKAAEKDFQAEQAATPAVDIAALEKSRDKLRTDLEETEARLAKAKVGTFQTFDEASMELGGVKKLFREAGDSNTGKPDNTHIVQQGGGGAPVLGDTGVHIR